MQLASKQVVSSGRAPQRNLPQVERQHVGSMSEQIDMVFIHSTLELK